MRYIILLCLFLSVASAQEIQIPTGAFMMQHTMKLDTLTNDSTKAFTLPRGAALVKMWMAVDTAGNVDMAIGIRGEELHGRFIDTVGAIFATGAYIELPVEDQGGGYICQTEKQIWVYAPSVSAPSTQIRIIIEYRQL